MSDELTDSGKSDSIGDVPMEIAPATLGHSEGTTSFGASHAGPRVERAEARQQRDAATAPITVSVTASDITDYKAFVVFLHDAGFSRSFAKRVTNRDAFKSAAETIDEQQIAGAIAATIAALRDATKEN